MNQFRKAEEILDARERVVRERLEHVEKELRQIEDMRDRCIDLESARMKEKALREEKDRLEREMKKYGEIRRKLEDEKRTLFAPANPGNDRG